MARVLCQFIEQPHKNGCCGLAASHDREDAVASKPWEPSRVVSCVLKEVVCDIGDGGCVLRRLSNDELALLVETCNISLWSYLPPIVVTSALRTRPPYGTNLSESTPEEKA